MSYHTPARNHPPGAGAKDETDEKRGRSTLLQLCKDLSLFDEHAKGGGVDIQLDRECKWMY